MSLFNAKSVLLGIGIGIIITATVSMIYIAGRDPMKDLTEQQIISQAQKYGMVKSSLILGGTDTEKTGIFKAESPNDSTANGK